jgi:hypothetical protein
MISVRIAKKGELESVSRNTFRYDWVGVRHSFLQNTVWPSAFESKIQEAFF